MKTLTLEEALPHIRAGKKVEYRNLSSPYWYPFHGNTCWMFNEFLKHEYRVVEEPIQVTYKLLERLLAPYLSMDEIDDVYHRLVRRDKERKLND